MNLVLEPSTAQPGDPHAERASDPRNCKWVSMGEPLANYRRVIDAVHRICYPAPDGLGISQRSVTVSTVGLIPAIRKLTEESMQVRLAVSLHTPDDELRDTLVPVNNRWNVAEVLDAARGYADKTGRRVSIEYALIRDINDHPWRADLLGKLLRKYLGQLAHVNVIPLNPTPGSKWDASPKPVEREFVRRVRPRACPAPSATPAAKKSPPPAANSPPKAERQKLSRPTSASIDSSAGIGGARWRR